MSIDLGKLLEESGAILKGHFKLTSGRHSDVYFEKFRVLEQPHVLSALCAAIADEWRGKDVDLVAGPTTGGIIIAFEVARQLGLPSRYIETENGVKTLRRNAELREGSKVLLVDDVLTTGLSLKESEAALTARGAKVVGLAVLIDRSENFQTSTPLFASYRVDATSYDEADLPDWLAPIPITKPGTRAAVAG